MTPRSVNGSGMGYSIGVPRRWRGTRRDGALLTAGDGRPLVVECPDEHTARALLRFRSGVLEVIAVEIGEGEPEPGRAAAPTTNAKALAKSVRLAEQAEKRRKFTRSHHHLFED